MTKFRFVPSIEIKPLPLNYKMDDLEDDEEAVALYHVTVSQGRLKMLFLVERTNPGVNPANRPFEVIRCEYLLVHGLHELDKYLEVEDKIAISKDVSIVNEIFKTTLEPFGLELKSVVFHDFGFFESESENANFVFKDEVKYELLKDLVNKKCLKMMSNPKINQI